MADVKVVVTGLEDRATGHRGRRIVVYSRIVEERAPWGV